MQGVRIVSVWERRKCLGGVHMHYHLHDRLLRHVRRTGSNMSEFGREAIREKLDREEAGVHHGDTEDTEEAKS